MIGQPCGLFSGIDETNLLYLINFGFDSITLGRMDRPFFMADMNDIGPCVNVVFNNGGIKSRHLKNKNRKNIMEFFE